MSDQSSFHEVLLAIGRLEGKMDAYQSNLKSVQDSQALTDARVRNLESRQAWFLGACAVVSVAAPYIVNLVTR